MHLNLLIFNGKYIGFDANQSHLLVPPMVPQFAESHLFRQDTDAYMLKTAVAYGATSREGVVVEDVRIDDKGVEVFLADGENFQARYLVDATGFRSVLADKLELRDQVPRAATCSRTIFTHVEGLRPFDELLGENGKSGLSRRWHDGTLHHVFDGGWFSRALDRDRASAVHFKPYGGAPIYDTQPRLRVH